MRLQQRDANIMISEVNCRSVPRNSREVILRTLSLPDSQHDMKLGSLQDNMQSFPCIAEAVLDRLHDLFHFVLPCAAEGS
jgi:hypothetical protein